MGQKIEIIREKIGQNKLKEFLNQPFAEMVKFVVDVKREVIALGGEMHADAEEILLADGSGQADLWGANIYPNKKGEKLEFESLINIRPSQNNLSLEIQDSVLKEKMRKIVNQLISLE